MPRRRLICWSVCVCLSVCLSVYVCPVHCGKTADQLRTRFRMVDRMGREIRQVVGFEDRSTGGGNFGDNMWGAPL